MLDANTPWPTHASTPVNTRLSVWTVASNVMFALCVKFLSPTDVIGVSSLRLIKIIVLNYLKFSSFYFLLELQDFLNMNLECLIKKKLDRLLIMSNTDYVAEGRIQTDPCFVQ